MYGEVKRNAGPGVIFISSAKDKIKSPSPLPRVLHQPYCQGVVLWRNLGGGPPTLSPYRTLHRRPPQAADTRVQEGGTPSRTGEHGPDSSTGKWSQPPLGLSLPFLSFSIAEQMAT